MEKMPSGSQSFMELELPALPITDLDTGFRIYPRISEQPSQASKSKDS
jgi:hypothetical protein